MCAKNFDGRKKCDLQKYMNYNYAILMKIKLLGTYPIIVLQHNAPTRLSFYVFTATLHIIFFYTF